MKTSLRTSIADIFSHVSYNLCHNRNGIFKQCNLFFYTSQKNLFSIKKRYNNYTVHIVPCSLPDSEQNELFLYMYKYTSNCEFEWARMIKEAISN